MNSIIFNNTIWEGCADSNRNENIEDEINKSLEENFIFDNWRKSGTEGNEILNELNRRGASMWIDIDGNYRFRRTPDESFGRYDLTRTSKVLSSYLSMDIKVNDSSYIADSELLLCVETYNPFQQKEFFEENGIMFHNAFRPSIYMQMHKRPKNYSEPKTILWFIDHLMNHDKERVRWLLNWLACFLKHRKKSQVALVLIGPQGSGKGIFTDKIIRRLYGKTNTVSVSNDEISSRYRGWIANRMFYIFNEVSIGESRKKEIKNFFKAIITEDVMMVEEKYKNSLEIKVCGNVIITTNESIPIEIEKTDRRFTVYKTGGPLKDVDGFNYDELVAKIDAEFESFAWYLMSMDCDDTMYNTPMMTPEKEYIVNGIEGSIKTFVESIKNRDEAFLSRLKNYDIELYHRVCDDLSKGRICQSDLARIFNHIYSTSLTGNSLLPKISKLYPETFNKNREVLYKSNGKYYYNI